MSIENRAMTNPIFTVRFGGTIVEIFDDYLEIQPGLLDKISTDKKIEFTKIGEVVLKEPTIWVKGTIHIATLRPNGTYFAIRGLADTFNGEARNFFTVSRGQNNDAKKLRDHVNNWIEKNGTRKRDASQAKVSKSEQLKALEELHKKGLISDKEFEAEKKSFE